MSKKIQVTLSGNERTRLIGKAAVIAPEVRSRLKQGHRLLLIGGTTVSAMSEEMGYGPMRISGRIDAGGTRTALAKGPAPHNLLIQEGTAVNADRDINGIVSQLNGSDLIVVGAHAIDP